MTPFEQIRIDATAKANIFGSGRISFSDIYSHQLYSVLCVIPEKGDAPVYSYRLDADVVHPNDLREYLNEPVHNVYQEKTA